VQGVNLRFAQVTNITLKTDKSTLNRGWGGGLSFFNLGVFTPLRGCKHMTAGE